MTVPATTNFRLRQWQHPVLTRVEVMVHSLRSRRATARLTTAWSNDAVLGGYTPATVIGLLAAVHPRRSAVFQALASRAAFEEEAAVLCLWGVAPVLVSLARRRGGDLDEMISTATFVFPRLGDIDDDADALLIAAGRIAAKAARTTQATHRVGLHGLLDRHRGVVESKSWRGASGSAVEAAAIARIELGGLAGMLADGTITRTRWNSVVEFRLSPTRQAPSATQRSHLRRVTRQLAAIEWAA